MTPSPKTFNETPVGTAPQPKLRGRAYSPTFEALIDVLSNPMGAFGLVVILLLSLMALFAPAIAPFPPLEQHNGDELLAPGEPYWLGTDEFGRDLLSRIIHGSRISLLVGVIAVTLGASVGVLTGLVTGYFGGWLDTVIMRFYDAILAFPAILLGIALIAVFGPGPIKIAILLGVVNVPGFARLTRASVLVQREQEYVLAARSIGCSSSRLIGRHLFPNCLGPILVQLSLSMGFAVLLEAGLSFLGLGTQPPDPSWGAMLNSSRPYLRVAWWYGVFPGLFLALLLVGLNYLSDALRDAVDPRTRN